MDVIEFSKQLTRMCESYGNSCDGCPAKNCECNIPHISRAERVENLANIVEKWAAEHPEKTLKDVLLEKFPEADALLVCPEGLWSKFKGEFDNCNCDCDACWNRPASLLEDKNV